MSNTPERATKKQQELLRFVDAFISEHDYGPSYREIMVGLGYKSVSTVATHVEGLITKGYLERKDNTARSLAVRNSINNDTPGVRELKARLATLDEDKVEERRVLSEAIKILQG